MSVLANINYMRRFIAYPCATPNPIIIVELAGEALLPLLVEFFSYQIIQVALPVAKQMGAAQAPTWQPRADFRDRRWERHKGHGVGIGPREPAGRVSVGEKWGPNTFLFRMVDLEQKLMFWWMLADLATEFVARWTSLVYMHEKCPFGQQCYKSGDIISIFIDHGTVNCFLPELHGGGISSGGFDITFQQTIATGKQTFDAAISVEAELTVFGSFRQPSDAWVEIVDKSTGERLSQKPGQGGVNESGTGISGAFYTRPKGTSPITLQVILRNNSDTETVGVIRGKLHIAGGFCAKPSPTQALDTQHLMPRLR